MFNHRNSGSRITSKATDALDLDVHSRGAVVKIREMSDRSWIYRKRVGTKLRSIARSDRDYFRTHLLLPLE
jgi:hypothetical protein